MCGHTGALTYSGCGTAGASGSQNRLSSSGVSSAMLRMIRQLREEASPVRGESSDSVSGGPQTHPLPMDGAAAAAAISVRQRSVPGNNSGHVCHGHENCCRCPTGRVGVNK